MAAPFAVRLRPDGAGGVEVGGIASRAQLARLRADRDTFALLVGAFGEVDVVVRPTTPLPKPEPPAPVWVRPLPTRRPWSGRTA
jgi:hypothetical protein